MFKPSSLLCGYGRGAIRDGVSDIDKLSGVPRLRACISLGERNEYWLLVGEGRIRGLYGVVIIAACTAGSPAPVDGV